MTSRYLEQLATIQANDLVSTWLFIGAGLIVLSLMLSGSIPFPRLRCSVQLTAVGVGLISYLALLLSPYIGAL